MNDNKKQKPTNAKTTNVEEIAKGLYNFNELYKQ